MHTRFVLTVLLVGCASSHATDEVASGIYELTIERELEDCAPARPTGAMGAVAVLAGDDVIDAPVPDAPTSALLAPRVRLLAERAFHAETNRPIAGCDGAWVHETWTVMSSADGSFELANAQRWEGVASCLDHGAANVPAADCRSERSLRYALRESCVAPCELVLAEDAQVACACR